MRRSAMHHGTPAARAKRARRKGVDGVRVAQTPHVRSRRRSAAISAFSSSPYMSAQHSLACTSRCDAATFRSPTTMTCARRAGRQPCQKSGAAHVLQAPRSAAGPPARITTHSVNFVRAQAPLLDSQPSGATRQHQARGRQRGCTAGLRRRALRLPGDERMPLPPAARRGRPPGGRPPAAPRSAPSAPGARRMRAGR